MGWGGASDGSGGGGEGEDREAMEKREALRGSTPSLHRQSFRETAKARFPLESGSCFVSRRAV